MIGTHLVVDPSGRVHTGVLVYRVAEYAFGFEPRPTDTDSSLTLNTLELMVNRSTYQIVFVEGYCPYQGWKRASLKPPSSRPAALRVGGVELQRGVAVPLNTVNTYWATYVDIATGWIRIGEDYQAPTDVVEFASGCLAILDSGRLKALWLRPLELPPLVTARTDLR